MRRWVVDASPLIFLAKLDRLELLRAAADEILIPPRVLAEVLALDDDAAERIREAARGWLQEKEPEPSGKRSSEVEPGELEVIAVARQVAAERVVIDDLAARRRARRVGLSPVGTLGLLLAARLRGDLPSVRDEITQLARHGFRASESLVLAVLEAAGESEEVE